MADMEEERSDEGKSLRIEIRNELLFINICSIALILIIAFAPDIQVLRIILGLPFILFFSGYTLLTVLFPKKSDLGMVQRIVLALGLSIAVVILVLLLLNYIWTIHLTSILTSIAAFIAVMSLITWYRRHVLTANEKPVFSIELNLPKQKDPSRLNKALNILITLAILSIIGTLGYAIAGHRLGEKFTEFYLLGLEGEADLYPSELVIDDNGKVLSVKYIDIWRDEPQPWWVPGKREIIERQEDRAWVTLGIVNQEQKPMQYELEMVTGETPDKTLGPINLVQGERWEEEVSIIPYNYSTGTTLIKEIGELGTSGSPVLVDMEVIEVESTEQLQAGDYIRIGEEATQIQSIDGNKITLTEALKEHHEVGTNVSQIQKVEFLLFKLHELEKDTSLSLWLGKTEAIAKITNYGNEEASYNIEIELTRGNGQKPRSIVEGPVILSPDKEWRMTIDYALPEIAANEVKFSIYRNKDLLYEEIDPRGYPTTHLWLDIIKQ